MVAMSERQTEVNERNHGINEGMERMYERCHGTNEATNRMNERMKSWNYRTKGPTMNEVVEQLSMPWNEQSHGPNE